MDDVCYELLMESCLAPLLLAVCLAPYSLDNPPGAIIAEIM